MERSHGLSLLLRHVRSARMRLRCNAALAALGQATPAWLAFLCCLLAAHKLDLVPALWAPSLNWGAVLGGALVLGWVIRALLKPLPWQIPSLALDRHHGLGDRVTNALEFQRVPSAERSELMQLALDDALALGATLQPEKAVPLRVSADFAYVAGLAALLVVMAQLEVRTVAVPQPTTPELMAFVPDMDDLQMMREMAEDWQRSTVSQKGQQVAERFNQLVQDISERRLDRHQVLERLEELERELGSLDVAGQAAMDEALQGIARALQTSPHTKPIAESLHNKALPDAEKALRELAEKLKNRREVNKAQLEALRQALNAAATESKKRLERIDQERRQHEAARERLLKKKGAQEAQGAAGELEQNKRTLERLQREQNRAQQAAGQVSELERQLAEAAQKLFEDMNQGAQHLEAGADDMSRMAKEQLSQQEQEALKKQLEALRELLRQQAKAGDQHKARQREFARRARGGKAPPQGQGKPQAGAGSRMLIPMGQVAVRAPGSTGPGQQQGGSNAPGEGAGQGTDANLKGDPSRLQGELQDVAAAGIDSGEGPSASQVVYGAAQAGFVGGGYKRIYEEYKTVAEEALEQDRVPAGYEAHVRRYFQLIRPRE